MQTGFMQPSTMSISSPAKRDLQFCKWLGNLPSRLERYFQVFVLAQSCFVEILAQQRRAGTGDVSEVL